MVSIDDIIAAIDKLNVAVKAVTFRNLAVIAILIVMGIPTYLTFWYTKADLEDILRRTEVLDIVNDCQLVRVIIDRNELFVISLNYRQIRQTNDVVNYKAIVTMSTVPNRAAVLGICTSLENDVNKILNSQVAPKTKS